MRNKWGIAAGLALVIACAPTPPPGVVYVDRGPPVDRTEVIIQRPGPDFVWIKGHWRWDGRDYDWVPGHWAAIERGYRSWAPGHWAHHRRGWYYVEGHWR
jgi:hypothetical protein